jgi:hypothetical protein
MLFHSQCLGCLHHYIQCLSVNQLAIDLVEEHCLQQCVTEPTREKNILDLVLTTNENLVHKVDVMNGTCALYCLNFFQWSSVRYLLAALYSLSFLRIIFLMLWFIHGIFHLDVRVFLVLTTNENLVHKVDVMNGMSDHQMIITTINAGTSQEKFIFIRKET